MVANKQFLLSTTQRKIFDIVAPDYIRNDPDPDKLNTYYMRLSWSQTSEMLELCQLLYSAGEEMEVVVAETQQMLDRFHRHFDQDFFERKLCLRESDSYTYILWLLGLAILVNDKTNLMRIPHWIGGKDWGDPIPYVDPPMKSLLNFLGYQGVVTVSEQAFFPKSVYPKLAQIISAQHSWQREELLQAYLKDWYKTNRNTYWYNNHKNCDGRYFFGYWSFEAGALALLLDIDTQSSGIEQMPFFPKDFVNWSRANSKE